MPCPEPRGGNETARIYQAAVSKKLCQSMFGRRVRIRGKIMIIRSSTVLSVASLIAAFAGAPGAAGEWATKEEAIALVKRAVVIITERGPEKAYVEITRRFTIEISTSPSSISMAKSSLTAKGGILS